MRDETEIKAEIEDLQRMINEYNELTLVFASKRDALKWVLSSDLVATTKPSK